MVLKLFQKRRTEPPRRQAPMGPPDARCYAIGDIHGCLRQLQDLIRQIDEDRARRPVSREFFVFLGDIVDRGPDSRGVVEFLMQAGRFLPTPVFIMGNHEEMMLRVLERDNGAVRDWLRFGGYECAQSYGVEVGRLALLDPANAAGLIRQQVPDEHLEFIGSFVDSFRFGDYLFVHAGIRPGIALEDQTTHDLRWIRDEFLDSQADHGAVVVHGHTITPEPDEQPNRIGIDTGAYAGGPLTAICIEGGERKYLFAR